MKTASSPWRHLWLAIPLYVLAAHASAAVVSNPPIRMAPDGVEYMCGGSGQAEAAFMETVAPRWAASFQFAMNQAGNERARVTGVKLVVTDAYNGYRVLDVMADAPHLLARLAPGSYKVEATLDGLTLIQPLTVVRGMGARATFVWPSNLMAPEPAQASLH
ncbi:MAG: hypothetical protein JSS14_17420 [Proteobacteria bacterium]|nr:hypothetical protein [Pseudomonadota bacterium]